MRRLLIAAVALSAVASTFVTPGYASPADPNPPVGARCRFNAVSDPDDNAGPDDMTGYINGGPLVGEGTLRCTFHVGGTGNHDNSPSHQTENAPSNNGVMAMDPRPLNYTAGSGVTVYLCTSYVRADGTISYWIPEQGNTPGFWNGPHASTAPPPNKPCSAAIRISTEPVIVLIEQVFDEVNKILIDHVDPLLCEILKLLYSGPFDPTFPYWVYFDDDGDVYIDDDGDGLIEDDEIWWDCPPYHTGGYEVWPDPDDPLE